MKFQELQKFKQFWLWFIVSATLIPFGYVLYLLLTIETQSAELLLALALTGLISAAVMLTFLVLRLETTYSATGITYRFYPVHLRSRTIPWEAVQQWEIKTYNPILEYGGWGLREGRNGKAFNVSGDKGILLRLKDGKTILFGTQTPGELKEMLLTLNVPNYVEHNVR